MCGGTPKIGGCRHGGTVDHEGLYANVIFGASPCLLCHRVLSLSCRAGWLPACRARTRKRKPSSQRAKRETMYAITSLTAEQTRSPPAQVPASWTGKSNLAISLVRLAGHTNIAKALRHKPQRAIRLA